MDDLTDVLSSSAVARPDDERRILGTAVVRRMRGGIDIGAVDGRDGGAVDHRPEIAWGTFSPWITVRWFAMI